MRRLVIGGLAALLVAGAGAYAITGPDRATDVKPRAEGPALMLVTTLPILFPEEFTLQGEGSKALAALETRYKVVPIGTTDAASLRQARLLLMAHPLAQPAENLVALDTWVRGGGRVLLLADPRLDWPSKRPLGDKLRLPPSFADTGLLTHWGLRLDSPKDASPQWRRLGRMKMLTVSPGSLFGSCRIGVDRLVARCRVGKGRAVVVADADFLNVEQIDGPTENNLDALLAELAELER